MIKYKDVTEKQFSDVLTKISSKQIFLPNTPIRSEHGTSVRDYHRVIHIGYGEGAVYIGWKHNSEKELILTLLNLKITSCKKIVMKKCLKPFFIR
ncbi:hypothetical protein [Bacillus thuringiensis]|nr:hypothetical protein [Bacillus thuringiensis]